VHELTCLLGDVVDGVAGALLRPRDRGPDAALHPGPSPVGKRRVGGRSVGFCGVRFELRDDRFTFAGGSRYLKPRRRHERSVHGLRPTKACKKLRFDERDHEKSARLSAYLPRGNRFAVEKSTSGISRNELLVGSVSLISGPARTICAPKRHP
jgi:hypothetical protein